MKKITKTKIDNLIPEFEYIEITNLRQTKTKLLDKLNSYIEKKAVLGIDIYKYSQFNTVEQMLIPHLFKKLLEVTFDNCSSP